MPYNPNIHRRRSIRLREYDYSQAGLYFVTICIQNHECLFGEIANGEMILNNAGKTVQTIWNELPQHFQHVKLDAFVIMPNHIHGIIVITNPDGTHRRGAIYRAQMMNTPTTLGVQTLGANTLGVHTLGAINRAPTVGTPNNETIINGGFANLKNPMFYENLGRMLRWFKGRATFECRKIIPYFAWQRNYWENIIRNNNDYARIVEYIENNPISWETDKFYK